MPAPKAKYLKQSPWVGTYVQRAFMDYEIAQHNRSLAQILREEINERYGIDPNAEEYLNGIKITTQADADAAVKAYMEGKTAEPEAAL
jgi:hypothetical protein